MRQRFLPVITAAALLSGAAPLALGVDVLFDNDSGDGLWSNPLNWENDTLPVAGDVAFIYLENMTQPLPMFNGIPTVTLNDARSVERFKLGGGSDTDLGDIQLRITTGATLNLSASGGDSNVGVGGANAGFATSLAKVLMDGGSVVQVGGSGSDIKLSTEGVANAMDSLFSISGGTYSSQGTFNFGRSGNPNNATDIVLEINGSGATSITVEDIKTESGIPQGVARIRFILDAGGVTPLVVNDEFQFENLGFELGLTDVPPAGTIVLAQADRISNDDQFWNAPEGTDVSAIFGLNQYTWTINYFDSSDDGTVIDAVVLSNLRITPVPEPASLGLLALAAGVLGLRRRA